MHGPIVVNESFPSIESELLLEIPVDDSDEKSNRTINNSEIVVQISSHSWQI